MRRVEQQVGRLSPAVLSPTPFLWHFKLDIHPTLLGTLCLRYREIQVQTQMGYADVPSSKAYFSEPTVGAQPYQKHALHPLPGQSSTNDHPPGLPTANAFGTVASPGKSSCSLRETERRRDVLSENKARGRDTVPPPPQLEEENVPPSFLSPTPAITLVHDVR